VFAVGLSLFRLTKAVTSSICGSFRGVPDIAAVADPYSGVLVYLGSNAGSSGAEYYVFGGTSLACPGNGCDVTVGNNTNPAVTGWDAASGLGVVLNSSFAAYLDSLP
jgi:hypothetical protein